MLPLPSCITNLESSYRGAVVHFVRLATMALAAELRCLVAAGGAAAGL